MSRSTVKEWSGWVTAVIAIVGLLIVLADERQANAVELQRLADTDALQEIRLKRVETVAGELPELKQEMALLRQEIKHLRETLENGGP